MPLLQWIPSTDFFLSSSPVPRTLIKTPLVDSRRVRFRMFRIRFFARVGLERVFSSFFPNPLFKETTLGDFLRNFRRNMLPSLPILWDICVARESDLRLVEDSPPLPALQVSLRVL